MNYIYYIVWYMNPIPNLIVNKDITIECETIESAENLYRYIINTIEHESRNIVSVFSNGEYNGGYYKKPPDNVYL